VYPAAETLVMGVFQGTHRGPLHYSPLIRAGLRHSTGVVDTLSTDAMLNTILIPGNVLEIPTFGFVGVPKAQIAGITTSERHRVLFSGSEWSDLRNAVDHLPTA
jgi:hypothetical protein